MKFLQSCQTDWSFLKSLINLVTLYICTLNHTDLATTRTRATFRLFLDHRQDEINANVCVKLILPKTSLSTSVSCQKKSFWKSSLKVWNVICQNVFFLGCHALKTVSDKIVAVTAKRTPVWCSPCKN